MDTQETKRDTYTTDKLFVASPEDYRKASVAEDEIPLVAWDGGPVIAVVWGFDVDPKQERQKEHANRLAACWNACRGIEDPSAITKLIAAAVAHFGDAEDRGETRGDGESEDHEEGELFNDYRALAEALVALGMLDAAVLEVQP